MKIDREYFDSYEWDGKKLYKIKKSQTALKHIATEAISKNGSRKKRERRSGTFSRRTTERTLRPIITRVVLTDGTERKQQRRGKGERTAVNVSEGGKG